MFPEAVNPKPPMIFMKKYLSNRRRGRKRCRRRGLAWPWDRIGLDLLLTSCKRYLSAIKSTIFQGTLRRSIKLYWWKVHHPFSWLQPYGKRSLFFFRVFWRARRHIWQYSHRQFLKWSSDSPRPHRRPSAPAHCTSLQYFLWWSPNQHYDKECRLLIEIYRASRWRIVGAFFWGWH